MSKRATAETDLKIEVPSRADSKSFPKKTAGCWTKFPKVVDFHWKVELKSFPKNSTVLWATISEKFCFRSKAELKSFPKKAKVCKEAHAGPHYSSFLKKELY